MDWRKVPRSAISSMRELRWLRHPSRWLRQTRGVIVGVMAVIAAPFAGPGYLVHVGRKRANKT